MNEKEKQIIQDFLKRLEKNVFNKFYLKFSFMERIIKDILLSIVEEAREFIEEKEKEKVALEWLKKEERK